MINFDDKKLHIEATQDHQGLYFKEMLKLKQPTTPPRPRVQYQTAVPELKKKKKSEKNKVKSYPNP